MQPEVQPKNLQQGKFFEGIIDLYGANDQVSLPECWRLGVRAILHQTSMGLGRIDQLYEARKIEAQNLGLLWGAYHLVSAASVDEQLDRFLSLEDAADPGILMAVDWETNSEGMMPFEQLREFITAFHARTGFYPFIYGGRVLRECQQIRAGDAVLAKCPLWYVRYTSENADLQIPEKTWANYTIWQFDDQTRENGAPYPSNVLPGADWNRFEGTEDDLRTKWPFRAH